MSDHVRRLTHERDRLQLLLEVNNAIVSHLDLPGLLRSISAFLGQLAPHDMASIALYDGAINEFRVGALAFPEHQDFLKESQPVALEGTPAGLCFKTRKPVMRRRIDLEEFPAELMRRLAAQGIQSGCSVPLICHERVLGVMSLGSNRQDAFDEEDVDLLGQIGKQVAMGLNA